MTEHNCDSCQLLGKCTRHPAIAKPGRFLQICRGDAGGILQAKWNAIWDSQTHGTDYVPPPQRTKATSLIKQGAACATCGTTPSFIQQAVSFGSAVANWIRSGGETVAPDVAEDRRSTCASCPANNNGWCSQCACLLQAKTLLPSQQCPSGKWLQWLPSSSRFAQEPTRNLIYHIWPNSGNDSWKWNAQQLLRRIEQFDGVRSIGVATGDDTASLAEVQAAFAGVRIDNWIVVPNDTVTGEGATFRALLETLPKEEGNVTFYGHAKGVKYAGNTTVRRWTETMYEVCLDCWPNVRTGLESFPMVGMFKRYFGIMGAGWHFSGTFFWFRNDRVFSTPGYSDFGKFYGCVEQWPATRFKFDETGCLFGDNAGHLYTDRELDRFNSDLAWWRANTKNQKE